MKKRENQATFIDKKLAYEKDWFDLKIKFTTIVRRISQLIEFNAEIIKG
jgi:hypothetical protein